MEKLELINRLENHPRPVIVDIWAPWCMPCRMMAPTLERLGQTYAGRVDVWKINADENASLVRSLGVFSIPTLIVYRGKQEIARRTGAQQPNALSGLFEAALAGEPPAKTGLATTDRLLRGFAGLALLTLGGISGPSLFLLAVGGIVLFSAVYDRCPVWRALAPRFKQVFLKIQQQGGGND